MSKIRFGVIGYGNIGKRHATHIQNNTACTLVAICDTDASKHSQNINSYSSLEDMLEKEKLDVISVCTPNYLHHPHTILCLKKGIHVICEKPMAISTTQCDEMIQCASQNQRKIFVVKQNRYNEPVQAVKKLLAQNTLGEISLVNINCFWNRNKDYYQESEWRGKIEKDGGCLFTQFSHFVDIMYYLFDEADALFGKTMNYQHPYIEIEDTGTFILKTKKGTLINFNFSTCSHDKNMEGAITILGEKGTVKIGGQYLNTIEYQNIHGYQIPEINIQAKSNDYGKYQGSMSNHDKVIQNVVNTLLGHEDVMTSGAEGKAVVRIIEDMYRMSS